MSRRGASQLPAAVAPMLASPDRGRLPDSPDYAYEYKYDGSVQVRRFPQVLPEEPVLVWASVQG